MALIKCSECGKDVSDKAGSCPHCGVSPVVAKRSSIGVIKLVMVLVFGVFVFKCVSNMESTTKYRDIGAGAQPAQATAAPPPPPRSPEVVKEMARLRALDQTAFCTRELTKVKKISGTWPQPWGEAITAVMSDHGVQQAHVEHIKKGSASIGMSPCGALASWGRPQDVNRSTYSFGTKEQWVYGGRNYLYFSNDKLDSIQH